MECSLNRQNTKKQKARYEIFVANIKYEKMLKTGVIGGYQKGINLVVPHYQWETKKI